MYDEGGWIFILSGKKMQIIIRRKKSGQHYENTKTRPEVGVAHGNSSSLDFHKIWGPRETRLLGNGCEF